MLVFRLFRVGKNNQPSFKLVVTDKRNPSRGGRFVEQVGFYNPVTKEKTLNVERAKYWLSQGVKPSDTIYNFFIKEGILAGKKIPVHKKSKKAPASLPAEASTKVSAPAEATAGKPAVAPAATAVAPVTPAEVSAEATVPKTEEIKKEEPAEKEGL